MLFRQDSGSLPARAAAQAVDHQVQQRSCLVDGRKSPCSCTRPRGWPGSSGNSCLLWARVWSRAGSALGGRGVVAGAEPARAWPGGSRGRSLSGAGVFAMGVIQVVRALRWARSPWVPNRISSSTGGLLIRAVEVKRSAGGDGVDEVLEFGGRGPPRPGSPVALQRGPGRQPATNGPDRAGSTDWLRLLGLLRFAGSPSLPVPTTLRFRVRDRRPVGVRRTRSPSRS